MVDIHGDKRTAALHSWKADLVPCIDRKSLHSEDRQAWGYNGDLALGMEDHSDARHQDVGLTRVNGNIQEGKTRLADEIREVDQV